MLVATSSIKRGINLYNLGIVQGDLNAKSGKDAQADWGEICGLNGDVETNDKGLRLLEFATYSNLVLTNTLGPQPRWETPKPD